MSCNVNSYCVRVVITTGIVRSLMSFSTVLTHTAGAPAVKVMFETDEMSACSTHNAFLARYTFLTAHFSIPLRDCLTSQNLILQRHHVGKLHISPLRIVGAVSVFAWLRNPSHR